MIDMGEQHRCAADSLPGLKRDLVWLTGYLKGALVNNMTRVLRGIIGGPLF